MLEQGALMAAGRFRTRVTIKEPTRTTNDAGESIVTFDTTHCVRWAEIETGGGREFMAANAVHGSLSAVLRMRSDSDTRQITPDMRIELSNRTWNIAAVYDKSEERKEIVIWATETDD